MTQAHSAATALQEKPCCLTPWSGGVRWSSAAPPPSAAFFLLFQIELKDRRLLPDLFPHRFNSVAELGRSFEIELVGRLQHLLLEFVEVIERNNLLGVNSRRSADLLVRGRLSFDSLFNGPPNRFGRNAVFVVVPLLQRASAFRFENRFSHRFGDLIGVEHDFRVDVARASPDRLNERRFASEKALFIGV